MDVSNEEWRDVVGYEGMYQVSSLGRVKTLERKRRDSKREYRVPEKIMRLTLNAYGYPVVSLHRDGKSKVATVHRLVAMAFLPNPENKRCVDHLNAVRSDNRVENLRWATYSENAQTKIALGRDVKFKDRNISKDAMWRMHSWQRKPVLRSDGEVFESVIEAARSLGYKTSKMVIENLKGKVDSVRGYTFKYLEKKEEAIA